ncbi:MAG: hypothetical protein ABIH35_04105 [Patescibacteria group bacterium]
MQIEGESRHPGPKRLLRAEILQTFVDLIRRAVVTRDHQPAGLNHQYALGKKEEVGPGKSKVVITHRPKTIRDLKRLLKKAGISDSLEEPEEN